MAAVALLGGSMSLGSLVGFVTLFGIAARNTILLVSHLEHLIAVEGRDWSAATVILAAERARHAHPDDRAGHGASVCCPWRSAPARRAERSRGPMAVVILGGLVSSTVASPACFLPALAWRFGRPPAHGSAQV